MIPPIKKMAFTILLLAMFHMKILSYHCRIVSVVEEFRYIIHRETILKEIIIECAKKIKTGKQVKEKIASGSIRQGTFTASMFKKNPRYHDGLNRDMDLDVEFVARFNITDPGKCLEDIDNKPGHLRILNKCLPLPENNIHQNGVKYFQHLFIKNDTLKHAKLYLQKELSQARIVAKYILTQHQRIKFKIVEVKPTQEVTKATARRGVEFFIDGKLFLSYVIDFAFIIKVYFTPIVMKKFLQKTTYTLPKETLRYVYIVAKTSHEEKNNANTSELSYSFSHLENYILSSFSDSQRLVYVIFKSIFCRVLTHLDKDRLTSYIVKTVVLWKFEDVKLGYEDWRNDTKIWEVTEILFQDLETALRVGFLPHYFIPEINILGRFDDNLLQKCIEQIEDQVLGKVQSLLELQEVVKAKVFLDDITSSFSNIMQWKTQIDIDSWFKPWISKIT